MAHHILVVDDDEILRIGICDLLEHAGYKVTAAHNGKHALDTLENLPNPPEVIISDIRMPHLDGYEFLENVRAHPEWLTIPFIFLSARGDREDIRHGRMLGADDYIAKPFDFQDLLVAVEASLQRREELLGQQEARLEALKQRILHVINHEFRTPLSYIVAYAELMANSPSFQHSDELRSYIQGIMEGSERLMRLVENFLFLAELESGFGEQIYQRREKIISNIGTLVEELLTQAQAAAAVQNVTLTANFPADLPSIRGDREYLRVAIRELIDNAIKFTPVEDEGTVVVTVSTQDDQLVFSIKDEGLGISDEEQQRLFDIFYQVDRERREIRGIGSGLAIARHIAVLHGGSIKMHSIPGKGSTFKLLVPICEDCE